MIEMRVACRYWRSVWEGNDVRMQSLHSLRAVKRCIRGQSMADCDRKRGRHRQTHRPEHKKMEGLFPQTHQWMAQILKGYSKTTKKRLQYTLGTGGSECGMFRVQSNTARCAHRGTTGYDSQMKTRQQQKVRPLDGWMVNRNWRRKKENYFFCLLPITLRFFLSFSLSLASNPTEQIKSNSERAHVSVLWSNWILFEIGKSNTATHLMHAAALQPGCITELYLMVFQIMWKAMKESKSL